ERVGQYLARIERAEERHVAADRLGDGVEAVVKAVAIGRRHVVRAERPLGADGIGGGTRRFGRRRSSWDGTEEEDQQRGGSGNEHSLPAHRRHGFLTFGLQRELLRTFEWRFRRGGAEEVWLD